METPKLCWVLVVTMVVGLMGSSIGADLCNPADKKALLAIKNAFGNGSLLASWKSDTDCCTQWNQVQCDSTSNRIISLTVFSGTLSGQFPDALGDLPFLQMLDFNRLSNVHGPIPSTISKLTNLNFLRLSSLSLTGTIPSSISTLSNLNFLDLSSNSLSSSIPSSLSNLHNLDAIKLDNNLLTGPIPASFSLFSGKTPDLHLSNNKLSGPIPASIGALDFSVLDFSHNQLTGDASFLFGKSKGLQQIDLSHNLIAFELSNVVFPTGLTNLDVNHNLINGSLPSGLTGLAGLQLLDVSFNKLCGKIPQGGKLQSFGASAYSNNRCLCGSPLPACTT